MSSVLAYIQFPDWIRPEIIPGLPLRWYGLMYLVAFLIAYLLFRHQVREKKLDVSNDEVMNYFFWIIIGLLLGARIIAATVYDPTGRYLREPWLIFWPFDEHMRFTGLSGMSYHGGLLGVVVATIIYCRVKKRSTLEWGDMIVTAVPLGYTFGRLGNFINGELYGRVTTLSWGMIFPHARRFSTGEAWVQEVARKAGMEIGADQTSINLPRHPSQLYEAFLEGIVLFVFMWFLFRKKDFAKGVKTGIYMIGYGIFRFFIEYVRQPDIGIGFPIRFSDVENPPYLLVTPWNFTTGQILNFLMILGGVVLILIVNSRSKKAEAAGSKAGKKRLSSKQIRKKIRKKSR